MVSTMKKWVACIALLAIVASMAALGAAEEKKSLSDFSNRLKKNVEQEAAAETAVAGEDDGLSFGPAVRIDDPFFQKVRSSAYLQESSYSKEANVMIELKNVSGRTLYPDSATITAYNAAGEVIDEETYANCGPDMVNDGENLYIWDWFYGFDVSVSEISYFEVKIESETSSYTEYEKIEGEALVSDGIAYALIENTTQSDIYGLCATICIENEEGTLLDICEVSTGNAIGIFPGSVMILRDNAHDYANDAALTEGLATVYALHQVD